MGPQGSFERDEGPVRALEDTSGLATAPACRVSAVAFLGVVNETERAAEELALAYELHEDRRVHRVSNGWDGALRDKANALADGLASKLPRLSCDFVSESGDGGLARFIEVKGKRSSTASSIPLLDRQMDTSEALGDFYWLYVGFDVLTPAGYLVALPSPHLLPWTLLDSDQPRSTTGRVEDERRWFVSPAEVLRQAARVWPPLGTS